MISIQNRTPSTRARRGPNPTLDRGFMAVAHVNSCTERTSGEAPTLPCDTTARTALKIRKGQDSRRVARASGLLPRIQRENTDER